MEKFAFIIHPLEVYDIARKFTIVNKLPNKLVEKFLLFFRLFIHLILLFVQLCRGRGDFISCPLTTRQNDELPEEYVLK